jgi:transcriptional regulator with XRE-family HTH domain
MLFGQRIKELRKAKHLTLRELAARVGVGFTYISKIENHKLEEGHCPSERLIHRLAIELDGDEQELLILAEKLPDLVRQRYLQRPEVFAALAECDDTTLDEVMRQIRANRPQRQRGAVI